MSSTAIWLTTGWGWWCENIGDDWVCYNGNLISEREINSRLLTRIAPGEIVNTILRRLAGLNKSNPSVSAVFGEPDFLPFRFLELGLRSGAAVCRLGRRFSLESANSFVNKIYEDAGQQPSLNITASILAEMLSLTNDQKELFFGGIEDHVLKSLDPDKFAKNIADIKFVPAATAFLVGRNYLLTNYHVLPEKATLDGTFELDNSLLKEYVAQFSYEQDIIGRKNTPVEYRLKDLIACDKDLDYALVTLEEKPLSSDTYSEYIGKAGDQFGWIQMLEDPIVIAPNLEQHQISSDKLEEALLDIQRKDSDVLEKFLRSSNTFHQRNFQARNIDIGIVRDIFEKRAKFGEPVNIIQHPKGRHKEIVVSNNWTLQLFENYLWYDADADFSSSGSPVFNQQWQLVALHHGAIPPSEGDTGKQEGVRICKIVDHLRELIATNAPNAGEIWRFFVEFVGYLEEENDPDKGKPLPPLGYEQDLSPDRQKPMYAAP